MRIFSARQTHRLQFNRLVKNIQSFPAYTEHRLPPRATGVLLSTKVTCPGVTLSVTLLTVT
jgi:hypothetical protein